MLSQVINKTCNSCKEIKTIDNFQKKKTGKYGVMALCKVCEKERKAAWRRNNLEKHNSKNALWRNNNFNKQKESEQKWRAANKGTKNSSTARRRASKLKATPVWADTAQIKSYYDVCSFFNEVNGFTKYHVDHIVPLQNNSVCGLHVHNNLQIITATENCAKGNNF